MAQNDPDKNEEELEPLELAETGIETLPPEEADDLESGYVPERDETPLRVPARDRRLVTQPYDLIVQSLIDQIRDSSLIVRPPYQRGYVWDDKRASRLIESFLMNIPIPPVYFAEEEDGKNTVIDGQQRLQSLWRFVNNEFKLKGLSTLVEFNNKKFDELTERDQRLIKGRSIRSIVITRESHPEIRFEVFYRLNTGSMRLTDQEIRNAIYRGDFNDLIKSLAEQPRWREALGKRNLDKRMRDDELVLRFFAVQDSYRNYQAPLRTFLNEYTESKTALPNRALEPQERERLQSLFESTVDKVTAVFENHGFRIYNNGTWEKQINRALFDAVMLVFSKLEKQELVDGRGRIETVVKSLCEDRAFFQTISRSTADPGNFFTRIRMFSEALAGIGLNSGVHETLERE